MSDKIPHFLDRLYIVALTLLMVFFAYQIYRPDFGFKTIKQTIEEAVKYIR